MDGRPWSTASATASPRSSATTRSASTSTKVDPADMQSMAALTGDKYKGRIAIYDYYLPVIGMAALAIGKKTPELTEADLPAIKDVLLR